VFAESVHGLLNKSRLTTRTAGKIKLSLSLAPRLVSIRFEVIEGLVLDGGSEPRPVVAQAGLDLLHDPRAIIAGEGASDIGEGGE
jgi:hypothetical protein